MQSQTLFRQQAVVSQQQKIDGSILLKPRLPTLVITVLLCSWLIGVMSWLLTGRYTYTQTVTGWLEPANGITPVYGPASGAIVSNVLVSENARVQKGTPLIRLTRDAIFHNGQSISDALIEELASQIARLKSQYSLTEKGFVTQQQRLNKTASRLTEDHARLGAMRQLLDEKMTLLNKQIESVAALTQQGFSSQQQLQSLNTQRIDETYQRQRLEREWIGTLQAIEDNQFALSEAEHSHQLQLLNIENQISELQKSLDQQYSQREVIIVAAADGRVTNLNAKPGQRTQTSVPLLSLMPLNAEVTAQLLIPVAAAGQISAGQSISLRYDAFPHTQFGTYKATVDSVSAHLLLPQEVAQKPLTVNTPVYLARATLQATSIEHFNQRIALRAGMTFAAEIAIRERNLMQWLFEPLYKLRGGLL